jgi:hypothetical protein
MHGCKTAICQVDETSCNTRPEHTVGSRAPFEKSASHFWCAPISGPSRAPVGLRIGARSCLMQRRRAQIRYLFNHLVGEGWQRRRQLRRALHSSFSRCRRNESSEVFARCQKQPKNHRPAHYRVESIRFCSRGARLRSNSSSMIGRLMCSIPDSAAGSSGLLPARVSLSHCFHSSVW